MTNGLSGFRCLAIIVSYNPEGECLQKLIMSLLHQVSKIVLIDNASRICPKNSLSKELMKNIEYIQLDSNLGLGAAHNIGINYAEENNFSHVLIMDQDSLPFNNMVENLNQAEKQLTAQGLQLAAVGPQFVSIHDTQKTAFISQHHGRCIRSICKKDEFIKTEHLISSGSLIYLPNLSAIGKMNEELFIDFVDIEWSLRAKSKNYFCYGICNALMQHRLGNRSVHIKFLNRRIVLHSTLRYYYQFRNAIYLYKLPYVSWHWVRYHFTNHILAKFILIFLFIPERKKNIPMVLIGIWHGLINKLGRFHKV